MLGSYAITPVYRTATQNADAENLSRSIPPQSDTGNEFFPETGAVLFMGLTDEPTVLATGDANVPFSSATVSQLTPTDAELGRFEVVSEGLAYARSRWDPHLVLP